MIPTRLTRYSKVGWKLRARQNSTVPTAHDAPTGYFDRSSQPKKFTSCRLKKPRMTGGHRLEPQEKIRNRCELLRSLARLAEPPGSDCKRLAEILELGASPKASEHTELFVHQLYPYASIYLGTEGQLGGEARDRIAGLWRILGQSSPTEPCFQ